MVRVVRRSRSPFDTSGLSSAPKEGVDVWAKSDEFTFKNLHQRACARCSACIAENIDFSAFSWALWQLLFDGRSVLVISISEAHPEAMTTRGASILVIDDDRVDQIALARAFKSAGLANPVYRASDGREALAMLRAEDIPEPRVILLDLNMPRMNGHEFLADIRKDANLSAETVFVLTTSADPEDVARAYERNIAGYITKDSIGPAGSELMKMLQAYLQVVELPA